MEHGLNTFDFLNELDFKYEMHSEDNRNLNLFLQDKLMKTFYEHYPEFICIDILNTVPELNLLLVLFISVDGNGQCNIVSVGLFENGNADGFVWICETFKKHNPRFINIEFILSNASFDRQILTSAYPGKYIFTSFFHSMILLKKDLSMLVNTFANEDINKILQIFAKMMFTTSESGYIELLKQLEHLNSQVFNLFKEKWHVKRDMWSLIMLKDSKVLLKAFNTYLLNIRKILKPMVSCQKSLEITIRNFHSTLFNMRNEWFQQITNLLYSPSASYLNVPVMQKYASYITPFASELIYEQLKNSQNLKNVQMFDYQSYYKINETLVSTYCCCCNFHKFMKMPCLHIFSLRKHLLLPQFVQSVSPTWIFEKYCDVFFTLYYLHVFDKGKPCAIEMCHVYEEYVRNYHKLWNQIFNCGENGSNQGLKNFQSMLKAWKTALEINMTGSEIQNDSFCKTQEKNNLNDSFKESYGISINDIIECEEEFLDISISHDDNTE